MDILPAESDDRSIRSGEDGGVIDKDDLVILGNRYEAQACAVDIDASCLVVCQNAEVSKELIKKRKSRVL